MIIIRRSSGIVGSSSEIQIILNGEKKAGIGNNKTLEMKLPKGVNKIKASQFGIRSDEIEVESGDILEIEFKKSFILISVLFFFVILTGRKLFPFLTNLIPIYILYIAYLVLAKGFVINKIDS